MQVAALQCVYHQMTAAGTLKQGGGASGRKGTTKAQRLETEGRMTIRSRVVENLVVVAAVVAGMPLIVMLFLGVLGYCYLEWLHDVLATRLSMPARPMRTIEANP